MRFQEPLMLMYFTLLTFAIVIFFLWSERVYRKLSARFAQKEMITKLTSSNIGRRRALKTLFDIIAIIFIGIALARPQWGTSWKQKTAEGLDIIVAVDLSKSMLAGDVKPDRLSYAKQGITDFVESLNGDRVGLIGFSGDAFLFCPMTAYYKGFFMALDNMSVNSLKRGGTSVEAAIKEAIKAFSWALSGQKVLLLISDGEQTEGDAAAAAEAANKANIQINCIGVGTREGSNITYNENSAEYIIVKDNSGRIVTSKLDEDTLKAIAEKTGGMYIHASDSTFGLEKIYEGRLSKFKKRQAEESLLRSYQEQFEYPLAIAFIAFFISTAISMTGSHEKD